MVSAKAVFLDVTEYTKDSCIHPPLILSQERGSRSVVTDPNIQFLTIAEVAELARVSKVTVYRWVHNGQLRAVRFGRSYRIPYEEVLLVMNEGIGHPDQRSESVSEDTTKRHGIA